MRDYQKTHFEHRVVCCVCMCVCVCVCVCGVCDLGALFQGRPILLGCRAALCPHSCSIGHETLVFIITFCVWPCTLLPVSRSPFLKCAPTEKLCFKPRCCSLAATGHWRVHVCLISRVGQNHIYTVHIRYCWQGNYQRCIYGVCIRFWPTLHILLVSSSCCKSWSLKNYF